MSSRSLWILRVTLVAALSVVPALAGPVLISAYPWGSNSDTAIMDAVFGAGNYTVYDSFAAATPGTIFTPGTNFVWLEGGSGTDVDWNSYVTSNAATILSWVNAGGRLLLMSAGSSTQTTTLGPGALTFDGSNYYACGTLTAAGVAAFPTTAASQCGNYLAHDSVTGSGLTAFMESGATAILAGTGYGAGYIMYSGLTDYQWHYNGSSLLENVVAFTAGDIAAVPEPGTATMLGAGLLLAAAGLIRRQRNRA